jgi:hypothetical protein
VVPDAFPDGGIGDAGMPLNVALVQQVTAKATTGATLTATLPAAPTDGDVLVMVGAGIQAQLAIVTGGGVTSWTKAAASTNNCNVEIWYGTSDGSSATISISYSSSVTDAPIWMQVSEWSGLSATGTLDNSTAASGTTGSANAGSLATHNATDLLIFAASDLTPNVFGTPTGGTWTAMTAISDGECAQSEWFRAVLTTGTYAQHVSQTGTGWDAAIAAFKIGP